MAGSQTHKRFKSSASTKKLLFNSLSCLPSLVQPNSAVDLQNDARVVVTINRDLCPRVTKMADLMGMTPNALVNSGVDALFQAVEGADPQAPERWIGLCQRATGFAYIPITKALTKFVATVYPDILVLEDNHRARFLAQISQFIESHGKIPEVVELRRIEKEVRDVSMAFAAEMKQRRQVARRQARQLNASAASTR